MEKIHLENFKGLKNISLDFAKFNVLTGLNSVGKTSVLQALAFLKQSIGRKEIIFNDYLLRLGDFQETVYTHDSNLPVQIQVTLSNESNTIAYDVTVTKGGIAEEFLVNNKQVWIWDSQAPGVIEPSHRVFLSQASSGYGGGEYLVSNAAEHKEVLGLQKFVADWFGNMLYLSANRGFTKYAYPLLAGPPSMEEISKRAGDMSLLEEWLSNLILYQINEAKRYPALRKQLDVMSERLSRIGVEISPNVLAGPSVVIDLTEKDMWVSAVNSGYGVNQTVSSIVLGTLFPKGTMIMIEEPEMHLHPVMQRTVTDILTEMACEGKQIAITCHSDHVLERISQLVAEGKVSSEDVKVYNFKKDGRETKAKEIKITDKKALMELF